MDRLSLTRRLGDPYSFALLQWPAVLGLFELPGGFWGTAGKAALGLLLLLLTLSAFFGRYRATPQFGTANLLCCTAVAAFWWAHPDPWQFLWLALLAVGFFAMQRALLLGAGGAAGET